MDKERRSRLKRVVGLARRVVEDDVKVQLRRLGIDEDGIKPVEKLPYLSVEDRELRTKIVEAIEKEKAGDISYGEAFARYVRHVGFTYVNRIAALRAMEVRNLIKETVIRRDVYAGRSRREYELAERQRISDPYELLKAGLVEAFNEVSAEIKVLFDVSSEYSLVFLGHKALLELIRLLSEDVLEEDWKADDIIGWIYQYYNEEARLDFRETRRKPKADDIPVINQFYTPRWIIRVLVDNTLGRLWLEMNGHCPKLGDPVKRTKEQLENPSGDTVDEFCSYLVPLSQEPPPRERKRVREIKVLDPACGSGHFLVYAFDVLFRMYREDEPNTPVEEIPRLILENNLFGIDIDLRAVQLAALSLYLKAKSYNPKLKITKMNLVCADARITDGKVRKAFLERFADDPELQRIFAKIFEDLEYTYEIGSLLKVREPFEKLLERRRQEKGMQAILFPRIKGQTAITRTGKIEGQAKLELKVIKSEENAQAISIPKEVTLEEMLKALRDFEKEAMEKKDMGTLLFASETEKSVGLLSLLSNNYDVVLMNPPYGDMSPKTKEYLRKHYPKTHYDYYAAFIEQAVELCGPRGFVGMLTSRTFMFLEWFEEVRTEILHKYSKPEILLDLGSNVLDEAVGLWASTVIRKRGAQSINRSEECLFFSLTQFLGENERIGVFEEALLSWLKKRKHNVLYPIKLESLRKLPRMPYSYWIPESLVELFEKHPPLDKDAAKKPHKLKIADLKQGLATADDYRFLRRFWEVDPESIGRNKRWVPHAKGGGKFYAEIDLVVNWENDGKEIIEFVDSKGKQKSRPQNIPFYFREGLSWEFIVSTVWLEVSLLPHNVIFSVASQGFFPEKAEYTLPLLGWGNSSLAAYLFMVLDPLMHCRHVGYLSRLPVADETLKSEKLGMLAKEAYDILTEWATGNEVSTLYIKPWILQIVQGCKPSERPITQHPLAEQFGWADWPSLKAIRGVKGSLHMSIKELADLCVQHERLIKERLYEIQEIIDETVYQIYDINEINKEKIENELRTLRGFPKALKKTYEESVKPDIAALEHIQRLLSHYIKLVMEASQDGILSMRKLIEEVRIHLVRDFGAEQLEKKEKEIEEVFGKSLEDWIASDYFDFHVNLYKRRPIFWHLTSSNFSTARGSKGIINIFIHYHKLDRDTIPKILTNYVKPEIEATKWKTERLKRELQEARNQNNKSREKELSKQLEAALSTLEELEGFKKALETVHNPRPDKTKLPKNPTWVQQKIAEVRDNGYNPVIDYGVRVNIEPLKEAGLLHKAAQRVK